MHGNVSATRSSCLKSVPKEMCGIITELSGLQNNHGQQISSTGPRSAVVSASDCGSEGLGFESHQSHVGFFGPGRLLPRAGSAMGPVGRLEPHSRASST